MASATATKTKGKTKGKTKAGSKGKASAKQAETLQSEPQQEVDTKPEARTNASSKAAAKTKGEGRFPSQAVFRKAAQMFKHLGDPTRLALIYKLNENEQNVGSLCGMLDQTQPAVSHHLALLKHGGVVASTRHGKNNFYRLTNAVLAEIITHVNDLAATRHGGE